MKRFLSLGECMVELASAGGGLYRRGFAGDTFNTAWYARRLLPSTWRVGYGTCVGTDAVSDEMVAFMAAEGIETAAIRHLPDRTVGLYMISVENGERSFSYWRGHSAARTLADDENWLKSCLEAAEIIHFSAITLAILEVRARARLCAALAKARERGARIAFDTNLRPRLWESTEAMRAGLLAGARVADIVLPSLDEEGLAFADNDPDAVFARYRDCGAGLIALKRGAAPVLLWQERAGRCEIPTLRVEDVADTTAAGDSFAAGLLCGLARGVPAEHAAREAVALAAEVIRHPGALVPEALGARRG